VNEEELREVAKECGYELRQIKRFIFHDRITFRTPEGNTLTLTLKDHIENIDKRYVYDWLGPVRRNQPCGESAGRRKPRGPK